MKTLNEDKTNERFNMLDTKLENVKESLEENESLAKSLENKLNTLKEVFDKKFKDLESNLKKEQEQNNTLKQQIMKLESEGEQLYCEMFEFTTTSKKGLKTHQKRKHSESKKEKLSLPCEHCEEHFESEVQLKNHVITHTYISHNSKLRCIKCGFSGENEWTMQIHNGKHHANQIECGLCEYKAEDLEGLEVHLTTCEIYECVKCEFVAKQLSVMKKHVKDECKSSTIFHIKIDRNNALEANYKEYKQCDLF